MGLLLLAAWAGLVQAQAQAQAPGPSLGRLSVSSALGEPLRAEIELNGWPVAQDGNLRLQVMAPQAVRDAGIEPSPLLRELQLSLVRRPDGRAVVQLSSSQPAREPFVDLLLQAEWSAGRVAREYTLLLNAAPQRAAAPAPAPTPSPPPSSSPPLPRSTAVVEVQPGDTLSGIAEQWKPPDLNLNQTMVALYRANPQAFSGNLNLLRAGAVLRLPGAQDGPVPSPEEAREVVLADQAAFESRRERLAAEPTPLARGELREGGEGRDSRRLSGAVQGPAVTLPSAPSVPVDRLSLAPAAPAAAPVAAPSSDPASDASAQLSAQAAAAELREREAQLQRLNDDLRRLQQEREARAASTKASPATGGLAVGALPSASQASQGLERWLFEEPWIVPAAAGLVLLLVGLGLLRLLRRPAPAAPETTFLPSQFDEEPMLAPSTLGAAGAPGPVEAGTAGPAGALTLEQALAQFDAGGEIDPIAEAEVYLAYGREQQAEEILREAMSADPRHLGVQVKLLEILAMRRQVEAFVPIAQRLRVLTGGEGAHWEKTRSLAQTLGLAELDGASGLPPRELDIAAPAGPQVPASPEPALDLDLGRSEAPAPAAVSEVQEAGVAGQAPEAQELGAAVGGLWLVLGEEPSSSAAKAAALERKLALAEEFLQIGDPEAARDLLQEVLEQGYEAQRARAQQALQRLG